MRQAQNDFELSNKKKFVIAAISTINAIAEWTDIQLAMEEILEDPDSSVLSEESKRTFFTTSFFIGGFIAVQAGFVVGYHMLNKFKNEEKFIPQNKRQIMRHNFVKMIKWVGLFMKGGLTFASIRSILRNAPSGLQYSLASMGSVGRIAGSYFVEGEHTHEGLERKRDMKYQLNWQSCLLLFMYSFIFLNHSLETFFSTKETADEFQMNEDVGFWLGISFASILGLQAAFLDAHHIEEASDYIKNMSYRRVTDFLGGGLAVLGAIGHAAPGIAGAAIIFRRIGVSKTAALIMSGVVAAVDFIPGLGGTR